MNEQVANLPVTGDPRALVESLARYRESSCARSILEIVITVVPFVLLWLMMWVPS
jgi:acyl-lipid omega-6 desaturase (Delta-12 desaturase)